MTSLRECIREWSRNFLVFLRMNALIIILMVEVIFIWYKASLVGLQKFDTIDFNSIYSTIVKGMSALLSISIALIVFRIQSLENRQRSLEESTLNYINQITGLAYPRWIPIVEEHIENRTISNRYYDRQMLGYSKVMTPENKEEIEKQTQEDRDAQQRRLDEVLEIHRSIAPIIRRLRRQFNGSIIFLAIPIITSLFMLIKSNALNALENFITMSWIILAFALGILSLIVVVLQSTAEIP